MNPELLQVLIVLLLVACALLAMGWLLSTRRAGVASRRRNARAQGGEVEAEALLVGYGFEILERQARRSGWVEVGGDRVEYEVRVDLLLARDGERFLAEIKTGELAPDPRYPPTRRQLREYAALFPDHRVLLVDVPGAQIVENQLP